MPATSIGMSISTKYLIVVGGPTASGKTRLAIELARHFQAPILSVDSRQFYREMRIGTARPTEEELQAARHYFIADRSITEPLNAGAFAREALQVLEKHFEQHDVAIVVGGSGLFIRALTEGFDEFPEVSEEIRAAVTALLEEQGLEGLQKALQQADPAYYEVVDQQNPARLMRALEVCRAGDHPYSYYRQQQSNSRPFQSIYLQTSWPREQLYDRINQRVDLMLAAGLEEEARSLLEFKDLPAMQTVGYQEWMPYFAGDYKLERVVELIRRNSRRYAKRQLTWLRRDGYWKHIHQGDPRSALAYIELVRGQGLRIQQLKGDELQSWREELTIPESRVGEELVISLWSIADDRPVFWARGVLMDDSAILTDWQWPRDEHPPGAILCHEWVHASRCEQVETAVEAEEVSFFRSQGWAEVPIDSPGLAKKLAPLLPHRSQRLRWRRASVPF